MIPEFSGHILQAKESAAKDNLRILREAIERYAADHNGIAPGYLSGNPLYTTMQQALRIQLVPGGYINDLPTNPLNNKDTFLMIDNDLAFPNYGWIYQAQTKTVKLDWPGTDAEGVSYYDY